MFDKKLDQEGVNFVCLRCYNIRSHSYTTSVEETLGDQEETLGDEGDKEETCGATNSGDQIQDRTLHRTKREKGEHV